MQSNVKSVHLKVVLRAVTIATLTLVVAGLVLFSVEVTYQLEGINQQTNKPNLFPQQLNQADGEQPNEMYQLTEKSITLQTSSDGEQTGSSIIPADDDLFVYLDGACTQPLTDLNWGTIIAGGSVQRTIHLKNLSSMPLTLTLGTSNWNPKNAPESITITWDKQNAVLGSGQSTAATITLSVASSVKGISGFGVTIVINGR